MSDVNATVVENGLAPSLMAAALTDKSVELVAANGISDLRRDVQEIKADIRESIQNESIRNATATLNLHNRLCESEKAAIEAKFEARIETLKATKDIEEKMDHFKEEVFEELCDLDRRISEQFTHDREEELENEVDELKAKASADGIINSVIAALKK